MAFPGIPCLYKKGQIEQILVRGIIFEHIFAPQDASNCAQNVHLPTSIPLNNTYIYAKTLHFGNDRTQKRANLREGEHFRAIFKY